ncbi:FecR family protein [Sphingobacterium chuzhouense]|uniref:FecR domain-containing protein n=1 Tax=Sphingobacterium chuzhouense TaxID=1742264 RepID=A0ABR7XSQ6_9SPHI|nr:FecR family protein [Sphingobacterium chuzhouense]MBD1422214.1 FecR domain-containing protein [Sphingobacterium chuzhouense]
MQRIDHIVNLLKDYLLGDIDEQRTAEIERLFLEYPRLKEIIEELNSEEELQEALCTYEELYTDAFREREERVLNNILFQVKHRSSIWRTRLLWRRLAIYSSAAAIIVLALFASIIWRQRIVEPKTTEEMINAFTPGGNKASLTLSNGRQINLSDAYSGIVIDGQIGYQDGSSLFDEGSVAEDEMLTLSTPRGGQYQVTLSDGTKVWLNAESKLHYPYRFSKDIRTVELEGEAYFEVAHLKGSPFIVKTSKEKVEVLGTHFNVNSYQADINSTVALLEGKVKVSSGEDYATVLKPGQQSVMRKGKMEIQTINVDECVAWKNGEFMFNNETLENVMKKVARWYDLDIELSSNLKHVEIWGSVSRYDNFNTVLKLIKMTDDGIRFEVTGRRVRFVK